jgi:Spy/CpxP family protein refolding chaperone
MGLALAAELNGYPGPSHVIELANELALTAEQRRRAEALFAAMKAEAVPLGEQMLAAESDLDRAFATHTITPASLAAATEAIGLTQARLRAAHLKYHLSMLDVLTPEQVKHYGELRGYGGAAPAGHSPALHHHMR